MNDVNWGEVLENLASGGSSAFIFPKGGRTKVRLLRRPDQDPFTTITSEYQGREKEKYVILAINMADTESEELTVKGLVLPKTAFRSVVTLLNEGYELFSPSEGSGLTIIRSGAGLDTSYSILPSQKPVAIDEALIDKAPTWEKIHEEYESFRQRSARKTNKKGNEESGGEDW